LFVVSVACSQVEVSAKS